MNNEKRRLIGELIGIARATDGNEHLIIPSATELIIEILSLKGELSASSFEDFLKRIMDEKRKTVPDCFLCANPCGRTAGFNFDDLLKEPTDIQQLKEHILKRAEDIATIYEDLPADAASWVYKALVVIGIEGYSVKDLVQILSEGNYC